MNRRFEDGAVPVIADATSMEYVLHVSVGETMTIDITRKIPPGDQFYQWYSR